MAERKHRLRAVFVHASDETCHALSRARSILYSLGCMAFLGSLAICCSSTELPGPSAAIYFPKKEGPASGELQPPMLDRIVEYCDIGKIEEGREFRVLAHLLSGVREFGFHRSARVFAGPVLG